MECEAPTDYFPEYDIQESISLNNLVHELLPIYDPIATTAIVHVNSPVNESISYHQASKEQRAQIIDDIRERIWLERDTNEDRYRRSFAWSNENLDLMLDTLTQLGDFSNWYAAIHAIDICTGGMMLAATRNYLTDDGKLRTDTDSIYAASGELTLYVEILKDLTPTYTGISHIPPRYLPPPPNAAIIFNISEQRKVARKKEEKQDTAAA